MLDEIDQTARILLEVSKIVNSTLDTDCILERILESVGHVLPFDNAIIFIRRNDDFCVKTSLGFKDPAHVNALRLPIDRYLLMKEVLQSALPMVVRDVRLDPRWVRTNLAPESDQIRSWMGLPISAGNKAIGVLSLVSGEVDKYTSRHVFLATAFAAQVSTAYKNALIYEEANHRLRELSAVNDVSAAINQHLELEKLYSVVGDTVRNIFKTEIIFLAILEEDGTTINTPYFYINGIQESRPSFQLGQGLTSVILKEGRYLYIDHDTRDRGLDMGAMLVTATPVKSWLGVPLMSGDKAIGVLSLQDFEHEYFFSENDIRLLSIIAASVSSAIQNARLYKETVRREQEANTLAEIGLEVSMSLNLETVVNRIVELAHPLLSNHTSAIYIEEKRTGNFRAASAAGKNAKKIMSSGSSSADGMPDTGLVRAVIANGRACIENDITDPTHKGERLLAVPFIAQQTVLGVLAVWRSMEEKSFSARDLQFAQSIARQTGAALHNAVLYENAESARKDAQSANILKTQFLSNMSHELRTPLNSIINFAYLIGQETLEEQFEGQRDMLGRIEESGRHLLTLINDVLDLAKIESGKMELYFEEVVLQDLVKSILSTTSALLRDKPLVIHADIPPSLPPLRADRTRLRQILLNLFSNAIKFTQEGSITVSAALEGAFVRFTVEDTGIGMKPEDIPKAFMEFVQLDGSLARQSGGTGLGLPISKRFVEMLGGSIDAYSVPGKGSRFSFTIPVFHTSSNTVAEIHKALPPVDHKQVAANIQVLLIDDDESSCKALTGQLNQGWKVKQVTDPLKVLELVRSEKPDAIVLDVMMPHLDGWEILKAIKADPEIAPIPVIMCSVLHDRSLALSLNAHEFLIKPVSRSELRNTVEKIAPHGGTILAVDDDENALAIISRVLAGDHYVIRSANSGAGGLESAKRMKPDIILLDVVMPEMDGFTVLDSIRHDESLADVPVILITSQDLDRNSREKIKAGSAEYLQKGTFTADDLMNIVRKTRAAAPHEGHNGKNAK